MTASIPANKFVPPAVDLHIGPPLQAGERLSAIGKIWRLPSENSSGVELFSAADNAKILSQVLIKRGINSRSQAMAFLDSSHYQPTPPSQLPDIDKTVTRIKQAIAAQQHITIYGDYDVDGMTATSLLLTVLKQLGASVDFYIPNRLSEGYGLNLKAISVLAAKHRTKLIITCDCGIANFAEINFAKSLGTETIVLDHHTMPELMPPAIAIVHPKLLPAGHPLFELPGVGVAFKVCEALLNESGRQNEIEQLLDYVTLGMIADLVPLIGENRYLVQIGLPKLINSRRPGIKALLNQVRKKEDTDLVGFGLAPRLNAVGRLSDAKKAVELLTTDSQAEAEELAQQLALENARRQDLCDRIFTEADHMVRTKVDMIRDRAIAIFSEGWHHGVIGIVASRLVEQYHKPVFIGELDKENGIVKGSARSIVGLDLYEVLKSNQSLLAKWGGHKMAAGFTVDQDKAALFCQAIVATCNQILSQTPHNPVIEADAAVEPNDVTFDLVKQLARLAPFGMGNKKPVLYSKDFRCHSFAILGKEGKHHRLLLQAGNSSQHCQAILWNSKGILPSAGSDIEILFSPEINNYNNQERLQLIINDWRLQNLDDSANATSFAATTNSSPSSQRQNLEYVGNNGEGINRLPATQAVNQISVDRTLDDKDFLKVAANTSSQSDIPSAKWNDLRSDFPPQDVLHKAQKKFSEKLIIFNESSLSCDGVVCSDRLALTKADHLMIWHFPPSLTNFQEIISKTQPRHVYLLGAADPNADEAKPFLKRLLGLIKYAVKQKEGEVQDKKLAALMASTDMSLALALTILRKLNVIDWFSEAGTIFLDLLGEPTSQAEMLAEYNQLQNSLQAAKEFRQWCQGAEISTLQSNIYTLE